MSMLFTLLVLLLSSLNSLALTVCEIPENAVLPNGTCVMYRGAIQVRNSNTDELVGTIGAEYSYNNPLYGVYGITPDTGTSTQTPWLGVQFKAGSLWYDAVLPLNTLNGPDQSKYPYLGWVVGPLSSSSDLKLGSGNYIMLTSSALVSPAGFPPKAVGNSYDSYSNLMSWKSETNNWLVIVEENRFQQFDRYQLQAAWINSDGTEANTYMIYLPHQNIIAATSDVPAFLYLFPDSLAYAVSLWLVPYQPPIPS